MTEARKGRAKNQGALTRLLGTRKRKAPPLLAWDDKERKVNGAIRRRSQPTKNGKGYKIIFTIFRVCWSLLTQRGSMMGGELGEERGR